MEKKAFSQALTILKESGKKNFEQSYELIVNLKNIDLKNQNNHIDLYVTLPNPTGKKVKLCALVGGELKESAESSCDKVILNEGFARFEAKKQEIRKLAREYDYFIGQATMMPQIAKVFGRVFGPRQRMPNPKAGCVVPPNANIKPLAEKLRRTVRLQAKKVAVLQCMIGKESSKDEHIVDNMFSAYTQLLHILPQEKNNIDSVLVKKTMSSPVVVGAEQKKEQKQTIKAKKSAASKE